VPVTGAAVEPYGIDPDASLGNAFTDSDGYFALRGLTTGAQNRFFVRNWVGLPNGFATGAPPPDLTRCTGGRTLPTC
jgi:hypothetical protein